MTIAILLVLHWRLLDLLPRHEFASIGVATNEKRVRIGTAGNFVVVCSFQSSEVVDVYCQRKGLVVGEERLFTNEIRCRRC